MFTETKQTGTRTIPRKRGPRPDPNGNPRVPNAKQAKRLAARHAEIPNSGTYPTGVKTSFFHKAGSQNRKK
jgi:hypothetical protein